jgi:hypothetical protein
VTISSQPSNQTAASGSATFSVTASATQSASLAYQWQKSTNSGSTWTAISGATSASLSLTGLTTGDNSSQYRVVVGASGGATSVTSSAATLTVTATPVVTISSQPSNQTAASGSATFSVTASATQSASLSYQWQKSTNSGSTWTAISGATSASLALSSLTTGDNGSQYRVVVGASGGATSVTSSAATLTVTASFTPTAVLLTSGTSYTVPSGATSMKAWAVGQGSARENSAWNQGGAGGCAYKTWSVTGGDTISYAVGKNTAAYRTIAGTTNKVADGGSSTVTYAGVTITGFGALASLSNSYTRNGGSFSGGDGGADGGGNLETRNDFWSTGSAVGGNSASVFGACYRRPATDVSGLLAAVALAGGKATETCSAVPAFGSAPAYDLKYGTLSIGGYGAAWNALWTGASLTYTSGAVVLYFT